MVISCNSKNSSKSFTTDFESQDWVQMSLDTAMLDLTSLDMNIGNLLAKVNDSENGFVKSFESKNNLFQIKYVPVSLDAFSAIEIKADEKRLSELWFQKSGMLCFHFKVEEKRQSLQPVDNIYSFALTGLNDSLTISPIHAALDSKLGSVSVYQVVFDRDKAKEQIKGKILELSCNSLNDSVRFYYPRKILLSDKILLKDAEKNQ